MPYVEASVRSRQLVEAARRVLIRDGVGRLTMRAVAATSCLLRTDASTYGIASP